MTSAAQTRATLKYKAKAYKRIPLDVKMEEYEQLKAYTERTGESVNGLIRRLIRNEIERGNESGADSLRKGSSETYTGAGQADKATLENSN